MVQNTGRGRRKSAGDNEELEGVEHPGHTDPNPNTATRTLGALLSKKAEFSKISFWIVGDFPLICHAWSHKARLEMLSKQTKATKAGREARKPEEDFVNSLYEMEEDVYGFPVTGIKKAILSVAHKDKGIPRTTVQAALWMYAEMVKVRPALAGAVCDVPLVRIFGSEPEMREDMVRIGAGLNKTASIAYRAQFSTWAMKLNIKLNSSLVTPDQLATLVNEAGMATGLGEWRNEKSGVFGSFHLASEEEEEAWNNYALGKGPLPVAKPELAQAAE